MSKPLVLSLQKFSVHDGPGIRTTIFFKGCPLHCIWCHNPESQNFSAELMVDNEKCSGCGMCIAHCSKQAIRIINSVQSTERTQCNACGECTDFCLKNAREIAGYTFSEKELLEEILNDQVFYEQSGGGVTFSGGEALCDIDILENLAAKCKQHGLHIAVDTCGYAPQSALSRMLPYTDLFLYDLKHMDPEMHRQYTGQDNRLILDNLKYLSSSGASIYLRLPLIEGINAGPDNIGAILDFSKSLHIVQVNLLPYHNTGSSKYQKLGLEYQNVKFAPPPPERLEAIRRQFDSAGLTACIGG